MYMVLQELFRSLFRGLTALFLVDCSLCHLRELVAKFLSLDYSLCSCSYVCPAPSLTIIHLING